MPAVAAVAWGFSIRADYCCGSRRFRDFLEQGVRSLPPPSRRQRTGLVSALEVNAACITAVELTVSYAENLMYIAVGAIAVSFGIVAVKSQPMKATNFFAGAVIAFHISAIFGSWIQSGIARQARNNPDKCPLELSVADPGLLSVLQYTMLGVAGFLFLIFIIANTPTDARPPELGK